jgi:hypothetical protein
VVRRANITYRLSHFLDKPIDHRVAKPLVPKFQT